MTIAEKIVQSNLHCGLLKAWKKKGSLYVPFAKELDGYHKYPTTRIVASTDDSIGISWIGLQNATSENDSVQSWTVG
jgi:hypothetical protein